MFIPFLKGNGLTNSHNFCSLSCATNQHMHLGLGVAGPSRKHREQCTLFLSIAMIAMESIPVLSLEMVSDLSAT